LHLGQIPCVIPVSGPGMVPISVLHQAQTFCISSLREANCFLQSGQTAYPLLETGVTQSPHLEQKVVSLSTFFLMTSLAMAVVPALVGAVGPFHHYF